MRTRGFWRCLMIRDHHLLPLIPIREESSCVCFEASTMRGSAIVQGQCWMVSCRLGPILMIGLVLTVLLPVQQHQEALLPNNHHHRQRLPIPTQRWHRQRRFRIIPNHVRALRYRNLRIIIAHRFNKTRLCCIRLEEIQRACLWIKLAFLVVITHCQLIGIYLL